MTAALYKLTCQVCGKEEVRTLAEAFEGGWDAPPHFSQVIACPNCPSSPLVLGHVAPKQSLSDSIQLQEEPC